MTTDAWDNIRQEMYREKRRCHAAFAHLRDKGEWFRMEPDLVEFIDDLRRQAAA